MLTFRRFSLAALVLLQATPSTAQVCTAIGDPEGGPEQQLWHNYWNTSPITTSRTYSDHPNAVSMVSFNVRTLFCDFQHLTYPELQKQQFIGYISEARPDIVLLQEVCNWDGAWDELQQQTTGYTLVRYEPEKSMYGADHQATAFLLKDSTVTLLDHGPLFQEFDAETWSDVSFRHPYRLTVRVNKGGNVLPELHVVNLHAKAGQEDGDYQTRQETAQYLEAWMAGDMAGEQVVVAGDFNDRMSDTIAAAQPGSPYQVLVDSPSSEVLTVCHDLHGQRTKNSTQSYAGSMLDHVIVSPAVTPLLHSVHVDSRMFAKYEDASLGEAHWDDFEINDVFSGGDGFWDFVLSDHAPLRFAVAMPLRPQVLGSGTAVKILSPGAGGASGSVAVVSGIDLMGSGIAVELTRIRDGARQSATLLGPDRLALGRLQPGEQYHLQVNDVFSGAVAAHVFQAR